MTLVPVVAIAGYLWSHRDELGSIVVISPTFVGISAVSTVLFLWANGVLTYFVVNRLGRVIGMVECLSLTTVTTAMNSLVPLHGGTVMRAAYLKRLHNFDYSSFLGALIGSQILIVLVCSIIATTAVTWMHLAGVPTVRPILMISLACLGISVALCTMPPLRLSGHWILERLSAVSESWHRLRDEPRFFAQITAVVGIQVVGQTLSYWTAALAIGVKLDLVAASAVGTLGMLSGYLSITPGALGIYEVVVGFVSLSLAAVPPAQSVLASLLSRAVTMAVLLVTAPVGAALLQKRGPLPATPPEP